MQAEQLMRVATALLFLTIFSNLVAAQDDKPNSTQPSPLDVEFHVGEPNSKIAPRYSPKGKQLTLSPVKVADVEGVDPLQARIALGANPGKGIWLVLTRSEAGKPYNRLYLDANNDGQLKEPAITCEPKLTRGSMWSSFEATLMVNQAKAGASEDLLSYPVALWVVAEDPKLAPTLIRFSRKGFLQGEIKHKDQTMTVVASDSNNDGMVGKNDWWELRTTPPSKTFGMRDIGDFQWAHGSAWKLQFSDTDWRKATLVPHDPQMTEEDDALIRDHLREDRLAARAKTPIAFRKDFEAALKEAQAAKTRTFVKFETEWCGPCKTMAELVFTAKDVADAAGGVTCVVVDGDQRKDLAEEYKVKGYPTGILLDAEGKEIARYDGYQSVKQMSAFFKAERAAGAEDKK
jgi:thiol-disulfide isomerase/thioredoxin